MAALARVSYESCVIEKEGMVDCSIVFLGKYLVNKLCPGRRNDVRFDGPFLDVGALTLFLFSLRFLAQMANRVLFGLG